MSLHLIARVAAVVAVTATVASYVVADLKGEYNIEFAIQDQTYAGKAKTTPGAKGAFTATVLFTSPSTVAADLTGKTFGDSVTYEAKYTDKDRGCTGTFSAKGTVEKDGSKANGTVDISDSCSGALNGTFRLWR